MSSELLKALLAFAGAGIGAVCGAFFKAWFDSRQERRRLRAAQQQTRWLPLFEASKGFRKRLDELSGIYRQTSPQMPFNRESLSADFRELYMLSRDELDLEASDANIPRANTNAVQKLRTRMAHHLNYAASSLYLTATYLGCAERLSRALKDRSLVVADPSRIEMINLLTFVRTSLQGTSGAGIPWEEEESVAEVVRATNDSVISYFEFRKRSLELPGWEQYMGLYRFFITFGPKVDYEVAATANALKKLEEGMEKLLS